MKIARITIEVTTPLNVLYNILDIIPEIDKFIVLNLSMSSFADQNDENKNITNIFLEILVRNDAHITISDIIYDFDLDITKFNIEHRNCEERLLRFVPMHLLDDEKYKKEKGEE